MEMPIDRVVAEALDDLTLDPLMCEGQELEDSLTAGYSTPETAASFSVTPFCCCSCCC
jgi:hypothetical protein